MNPWNGGIVWSSTSQDFVRQLATRASASHDSGQAARRVNKLAGFRRPDCQSPQHSAAEASSFFNHDDVSRSQMLLPLPFDDEHIKDIEGAQLSSGRPRHACVRTLRPACAEPSSRGTAMLCAWLGWLGWVRCVHPRGNGATANPAMATVME